jgi:hypothetical protein
MLVANPLYVGFVMMRLIYVIFLLGFYITQVGRENSGVPVSIILGISVGTRENPLIFQKQAC